MLLEKVVRRGWATTATLTELASTTLANFDIVEDELGFYVPQGNPPNTADDWPSTEGGSFPFINQEQISDPTHKGVLFSNHPGIVVVSFCDGHQTTIVNEIDPTVFMHLMTPDSKKAFNTSWKYYNNTELRDNVLDEADF